MKDTTRWIIMTVLLIVSFIVYDPKDMFWTWTTWGGMVVVIIIDYVMWREKRKKLKQKK